MTREEFVSIVQRVVLEAAVEGTMATLERPPGRRPDEAMLQSSRWFHGLSERDRREVERLTKFAAHQAVFGFLAMLDGVRVIDDTEDKGRFLLTFEKSGKEWPLITSDGPMLHEILNRSE